MLLGVPCSSHTVVRSLKSVYNGGFIKDGADHRKGNLLATFSVGLKNVLNKDAEPEILLKEIGLFHQTPQISQDIIHAKKNQDGYYSCETTFGDTRFFITQSSSEPSNLEIVDHETGEKDVLENVTFPELQKRVLAQHIKEQLLSSESTDLSSLDLTGTEIDLSQINFSCTVLNTKSLSAIITKNGNIRDVTLAAGEDASQLDLAGVALDRTVAESLIQAGASFYSVLKSYLGTQYGVSVQDKTALLKRYLEAARQRTNQPIDLSAVDLSKVNCKDICFDRALLSLANLQAIIAGGGNLEGATLTTAMDLQFDAQGMNKTMALKLIQAGVDRKTVFKAYLAEQRNRKQVDIHICEFDLTGLDLQNVDLRDVNLSPLWRYQGKLMIGVDKFDVTKRRGRVQVDAEQSKNAPAAQQIERKLNASPARENEITTMTHDALPSALQRLSSDHWVQIGNSFFNDIHAQSALSFQSTIKTIFYDGIYAKASSNIKYKFLKSPKENQSEWRAMVSHAQKNPDWKPDGIKYGRCGHVQMDDDDRPHNIKKARVYLRYQDDNTKVKSRLQFVVSSEAGSKLYSDIAKVMDNYIDEKCNGDLKLSPVKNYKVFSEDQQVNRSDSAVIYLSVSLSDPRVQDFVEFLNQSIKDRLAPIDIIGATPIAQSYIQGITIPDSYLQAKVTGKSSTSHGGLTGNILTQAYKQAYEDTVTKGVRPNDVDVTELNQRAQFYAKEMWSELGL